MRDRFCVKVFKSANTHFKIANKFYFTAPHICACAHMHQYTVHGYKIMFAQHCNTNAMQLMKNIGFCIMVTSSIVQK